MLVGIDLTDVAVAGLNSIAAAVGLVVAAVSVLVEGLGSGAADLVVFGLLFAVAAVVDMGFAAADVAAAGLVVGVVAAAGSGCQNWQIAAFAATTLAIVLLQE